MAFLSQERVLLALNGLLFLAAAAVEADLTLLVSAIVKDGQFEEVLVAAATISLLSMGETDNAAVTLC